MTEEIVLVNESGAPIGRAPKLESHNDHTPFHLGFSCYLFSEKGEFLLTQRALTKKVWPGVWTNSVCGHPAPNESVADAIARRSQYELGLASIDSLQVLLPDYRYKTPPFKGIIENEFCPVYIGVVTSEPKPNPEEVESYKWLPWPEVIKAIAEEPELYSYWFKDQIPKISQLDVFKDLSKTK